MREQEPDASRHVRKVVRIVTRLNIGGPARQVLLLSHALNRNGWQTVVVCGGPQGSEGDLSHQLNPSIRLVRVHVLQRAINPLKDALALWQLIRLVFREHPKIIHTHMAKAGMLGRLAGVTYNRVQWMRGRAHRIRLVHTFHGHVLSGYFGRIQTRVFTRLERWMARWTDALIAVSPSVRDDLLMRRIGDQSRIRVVPLGLELSTLLSVNGPSHAFRDELGVSPTTPLIGIVGRLAPIKQHELFLQAAKRLIEADPSRQFVIVGDGERRSELEAMTRQLGLERHVRFTGWRLDLPDVYADLDCVCLTSRNEGTPVSVIEALASAKPVVATAVGGVPDLLGELVEQHEAYQVARRGLLVPLAAQAHGIAAAVERVLADAPLRARLMAEGRAFAKDHLTTERLVRDLEALYDRLLGSVQGSRAVNGYQGEVSGP